VGDLGSGTSDETAVASLIASWRPDFVLTVGDNAYPLGSTELLDRDVFRPYAAVMRESAWFPALGNHDVKANGGAPELEAFHSLGKERWYRFTWGNAAVVVLDSETSVAPGSPQLRFARRASARRSCLRFAAWHHPPWEPRGRSLSPGLRRNVVPLMQQDGIQVVFVGHLHAYARSRPHGRVVYVAVGTGGAALDDDARTLTIPSARIVQGRFGARADRSDRGARPYCSRRAMAIRTESRIAIAGSVPEVWAYVCDVGRWPEWAPTVLECRVRGGAALEPGARVDQRARGILGWSRDRSQEVTAVEAPRHVAFAGPMGTSAARWGMELQPMHERQTDAQMWIEVDRQGIMRAIPGRMLKGRIQRVSDREMAAIKAVVESATPGGPDS
jgi:hypothetical protein